MKVRFKEARHVNAANGETFEKGRVYDLSDASAQHWISRGVADAVDDPTDNHPKPLPERGRRASAADREAEAAHEAEAEKVEKEAAATAATPATPASPATPATPNTATAAPADSGARLEHAGGGRWHVLGADGKRLTDQPLTRDEAEARRRSAQPSG